jgi:hypothetical protein
MAGTGSKPLISVYCQAKECVELYVLYLHTPLYAHCVVLNETWRQCYLIWSVFISMSCDAYYTKCWMKNRWITIKIMYLFTGNSDKVPFQVIKNDHVVIVYAFCYLEPKWLQMWTCNLYYTLCFCFVYWLLYNTGQCCSFTVFLLCVPWRRYHNQKWSILFI